MRVATILAAGVLLAPGALLAQTGPQAQRSPEELVCALSGDCNASEELEALSTESKGEDRGFRIMQQASNSGSQRTAAAPPAASRQANVARAPSQSPTIRRAAAPRNTSASRIAAAPVSKGDLMVTFVTGSAELTEQAKANVRAFAQALKDPRLAGKRFRIEGHTDAVGARDYNLDLSMRRAEAVVEFLVNNGADRSVFEVEGHGFDKPLPGMSRLAGANRRVEAVRID